MESVTHRVVHNYYGVVKYYIHLVSTRSAGIYYSIIIPSLFVYRIAGNFRGTKYLWFIRGSAILIHCVGNISWLELALQVKVGKVASFVGKIFVVRPPTTKTTNILLHENYTLYGIF